MILKCFLQAILPLRELRETQTNSTDQATVYSTFLLSVILSQLQADVMNSVSLGNKSHMLSQEFKGRHIACPIPELQKVHDYVTLNTARRLKLQSWNESYFCCMKVNFLQGKMSRRTPEGTLSFCSNPGCKVLSKHKVIWDTHSFSFFGISRLLRESLSTLREK